MIDFAGKGLAYQVGNRIGVAVQSLRLALGARTWQSALPNNNLKFTTA